MGKPKHTPGPWHWVRSDDCNDDDEPGRLDDEHGIVLSAIESRTRHAYSQGNPIVECDPANAQLIASAPALLEALEANCKALDEFLFAIGCMYDSDFPPAVGQLYQSNHKALREARAALAKARGES